MIFTFYIRYTNDYIYYTKVSNVNSYYLCIYYTNYGNFV